MTARVPFLDVRAAYRELREEIDRAIARVLESGRYILGEEVEAFEREFAAYVGARYSIGVGNGLDALELSLRAAGVGLGDEVIVPGNTFIATWLAVSRIGARPVPIDPREDTGGMDPDRIEEAITPRTRAVVAVHLYGHPVDLDAVLDVTRRFNLPLVEDAAQAHGARYKARRVGAAGTAVAWSFYPTKNLAAMGDGGAVSTNDPEIAERLRLLRNYGSETKYVHETLGWNSRLDPLQAAVLRVKLRCLDEWNERRSRIAALYLREIGPGSLVLPRPAPWASPAWHLFVVRSSEREALMDRLAQRGVETMVHYPVPPHLQRPYRERGYGGLALPITERLAREVLSLPLGPHLTEEAALEVAGALESVVA